MPAPSLYDRLGGAKGIAQIVNGVVDALSKNRRGEDTIKDVIAIFTR